MCKSGLRCGLFALIFGMILSGNAFAQLEGHLFMDKDEYAKGEPIYLRFDLTNKGTSPIHVFTGSSYTPCGGYEIDVSNKPSSGPSTCDSGRAVNCIIGGFIVGPGEMQHDKVLLNYEHNLSAPGVYEIRATRILKFGPPGDLHGMVNGPEVKADAVFHIRVVNAGENLTLFQPYVEDLDSKDEERQQEAARAISSLAPPWLEDTILRMAFLPKTRLLGLLGLRRLNSGPSRRALAEIVQGTSDYSYEREKAIRYLSEMRDKTYLPLLVQEATKHEPNQAGVYVMAAARLGGEDALPYVFSLLNDPNPFAHGNGVQALPETGSRQAVRILIELLRSRNVGAGRVASVGLIHLTHRSPYATGKWFSDTPSNDYAAWIGWWMREGGHAPIYGPDQCGRITPLN